jgi:UDP-3-O-[3-hydroxymyristoyl] glucosamine N-acyltransferase
LGLVDQHYPDMLVFVESRRFVKALTRNQAVAAVFTTPQLADMVPANVALGVCENPRLAFAQLHNELARSGFYWQDFSTEIHPEAAVHPSAWVAERNVRIGAHVKVGPLATILERCCLAESVSVGASTVLGGVGFQTVRTSRPMVEMDHCGGLTIHAGARILPGSMIATATFRDATEVLCEVRIGAGAFLSHDVRVGARSFIGHRAVINGHVTIGEEAWVGPGAVVANNLEIGDCAFVGLGAVVIRNVPARGKVSGNFAISHQRLLRATLGEESSWEK